MGHTGTLITIDSVLEKLEEEGVVDIFGTVSKIRQERMNMVQTVVNMHMYVFGVMGKEYYVAVHTYAHLYKWHISQRLFPAPPTPSLQEQYIFIHDAVLECDLW